MCPFSTVTEPNFFRYASACALSSVPQPHSGYTDHRGMCANTTIGVLCFRCLTSFSIHSSCSPPSEPSPPAFRFITFTSPMKCTPFLSKLYHPAPWAAFPYRSRYDFPLSSSTSCSPGTKNTSFALAPFKIWSTLSNSSGFERWLMSPVCNRNSGGLLSPLIFSTAAFSVPATSGFAGLLNPIWLSLICTKLSSPIMSAVLISEIRLKLYEFSTPPFITQKAPVPAQAMHFRNPRRSTPSWLWSCRSSSFFFSDILALLIYYDFYPSSKICTCRWDWRRGMGVVRAAIERTCVHPDRGSACLIPSSSGFMSLFACSSQQSPRRE